MIWQTAEFTFDENTKVLSFQGNPQLLEPKTAAVLAYLCRNPNQDISRNKLMINLWQGQIVADNTINRVIVLLRKAFKDEDKIK
jgi:DNA-binding winged helix-turn-helix (wHTH) protein